MNVDQNGMASSHTLSPDETKAKFKQRARLLARPLRHEANAGDSLQVVEFRLAEERYALEHTFVQQIRMFDELTPLPGTPAFLMGIINVRGQFLPVINIKRFFDLPETGIGDLHVVIIIESHGVEIGILADAIMGIRAIPLDHIQPPLPTLTGIRSDFLKGITGECVVVIDALKILTDPKLVVDVDPAA